MTKRYWPYYRDTVRYPEIQWNGPLALLAEADGDELDVIYESALKVRDQFFPSRAENEGVLFHGRGRGVPRHLLENDDQYRLRVERAWAWQWLAGRFWGLHKIFDEYGFPVIHLENLKDDHWAEFDIEVESPPGVGLGDDVFDLIFWLIFEYKRASAMLRTLRVTKRTRGRFKILAAPLIGEHITIYPPPPKFPEPETEIKTKTVPVIHEQWRIGGLA